MKKLSIYFGLIVVSLSLMLTSCTKPNGVLSMMVTPNDTLVTANPGDTLTWTVTVVPDAVEESTVGTITVTAETGGTITTIMDSTFNSEGTVNTSFGIIVPNDAQDGQVILVSIVAKDGVSGNTVSFETKVTVEVEQEVYQEVTSITLNWDTESMDETWGLLLSKDGAQAVPATNKDAQIMYVYNGDASYLNMLVSPDASYIAQAYNGTPDYDNDGRSNTLLNIYTTKTWAEINKDVLLSLKDEITTSHINGSTNLGNGVDQLKVGDVIVFQNTTTNVVGAILIKNVSNAKYKFSTNMTVDVKYVVMPTNVTTR